MMKINKKEKDKEESKGNENYFFIREISYNDAKREIINFLESSDKEISISDIITNLRIDLETVLAVLDELHEEGNIKMG